METAKESITLKILLGGIVDGYQLDGFTSLLEASSLQEFIDEFNFITSHFIFESDADDIILVDTLRDYSDSPFWEDNIGENEYSLATFSSDEIKRIYKSLGTFNSVSETEEFYSSFDDKFKGE